MRCDADLRHLLPYAPFAADFIDAFIISPCCALPRLRRYTRRLLRCYFSLPIMHAVTRCHDARRYATLLAATRVYDIYADASAMP